ncbi:uncharacterized protein B0T23DRAFT_396698 [Neurospora hispaniola]|uniref:Uncharacterized protein n=1 Tax=Neurospora hispaniola TaxID=588809 RepID=A0AAJ0MQ71_9PEZI|nr:hypothetical protein B0T23DRAFT_396698 [Neurospora hispaniola]
MINFIAFSYNSNSKRQDLITIQHIINFLLVDPVIHVCVEGTNLLLSPATTPPWENRGSCGILRNRCDAFHCGRSVRNCTSHPPNNDCGCFLSSAATGKGVVDILMGDIAKPLRSLPQETAERSAGY